MNIDVSFQLWFHLNFYFILFKLPKLFICRSLRMLIQKYEDILLVLRVIIKKICIQTISLTFVYSMRRYFRYSIRFKKLFFSFYTLPNIPLPLPRKGIISTKNQNKTRTASSIISHISHKTWYMIHNKINNTKSPYLIIAIFKW